MIAGTCHSEGASATEESSFHRHTSSTCEDSAGQIPLSPRLPRDDRFLSAIATLTLILLSTLPSHAQTDDGARAHYNYPEDRITVPSWRFAHGPHVRASFRDVVADARRAVVEVQVDGSKVALGGVVGADGWILTKASALSGKITCQMSDGRGYSAEVAGIDREFDLAMLRVTADDLPTLEISESTAPVVGSWLATVGMDSYPLAVGVVSVEPRTIPHQGGILGVQLNSEDRPARIVRVFPGSAAAKAGLLVNDIILEIEGKKTASREALVRRVQEFSPGDTIQILAKRDEEELKLSAILMGRFPGLRPTRNEFQNLLGSGLSERRFGFESAFQHDTVIEPTDVGGPVVNLDGQVVGFNIARSGRTETYAIAADSLAKVVKELMIDTETASEVPLVPRVPVTVP